MSEAAVADVLTLPRRLAIQILHEAQVAQPASIRGVVLARDGEPRAFRSDGAADGGQEIWARLWSYPDRSAEPGADELDAGCLNLVVSLNTKGVLEMRAWRLDDGRPVEQVLKVRD